jgi:hypothetical protein
MFEFVHYFQFVQQYLEQFFRIIQNDYETISGIHINVRFREATKKINNRRLNFHSLNFRIL